MALSGADPRPLSIPAFSMDQLNFLESVESAHASHSFHDLVARNLALKAPPTRMDSQAKYCALARGDGGVYIRMLTSSSYKEKIWVSASNDAVWPWFHIRLSRIMPRDRFWWRKRVA